MSLPACEVETPAVEARGEAGPLLLSHARRIAVDTLVATDEDDARPSEAAPDARRSVQPIEIEAASRYDDHKSDAD